eukprot:scaffold224209_cov32-Prasinocladus_malaysianus.AAC.1
MDAEMALEHAKPMVPILYKERRSPQDSWLTVPHFLENTIPGFTSGGVPEVVGVTFSLEKQSLDDLAQCGVRLHRCDE